MKTQILTITKITFLALLLSNSIVSCSTDSSDDEEMEMEEEQEEDDSDLPIVDGTFAANVDGVAFEPYEIQGGYQEIIANEGNLQVLQISAISEAEDEGFGFTIYNESLQPGSYDFDIYNDNSVTTLNLAYLNIIVNPDFGIYAAVSGNITIMSHDILENRIIGTFNFSATNPGQTISFDITAGEFDIVYRE